MWIRTLHAVGWRNLEPLRLPFDAEARLGVFYGDNAQGKTNLLEALYYLAAFRSFRTSRSADLIRHGTPEARIGVEAQTGELVRAVEVRLQQEQAGKGSDSVASRRVQRAVSVDGKTVRGIAAAYGLIAVVLFVPEDLLLVRAAPVVRRRFMDMAVSGLEPAYFAEASSFQKVLRSRNALFRGSEPARTATLLDTYDEQLAVAGARIVIRRRKLVQEIGSRADNYFRSLHANLGVVLEYQSDPAVTAAGSEGDVAAALRSGLGQRRRIDERRGYTTFGPHTDDLAISVGGRAAREHASQGQLRSLVLALKLGELAAVEERRRDSPVLLLDDVPSELDPRRRRYLFETLGALSCQTLVSVADREVVPPLAGRVDLRVVAGQILRD